MKFRHIALVVALVTLWAIPVAAQTEVTTGPLTTATSWEVVVPSNIATAADAQTYEMRIKRDTALLTTLAAPVCTQRSSTYLWILGQNKVTCLAQLSQANVDAMTMAGVYNLTATFFRADVGESAPLASPFVLRNPPGAPTGLRITR